MDNVKEKLFDINRFDVAQILLREHDVTPEALAFRVSDCLDFINHHNQFLAELVVSLYMEVRRLDLAAKNILLHFDREKENEEVCNAPGGKE